MFTTTWHSDDDGLKMFVADSLLGKFKECAASPTITDYSYMRNGGAIISEGSNCYRPAQYDVNYYGENLSLNKVENLSEEEYEETFVKYMIDHENSWSRYGGHHMSTVIFNGERIVVFDGRIKDNWVNNRTRWIFSKKTAKE